MPDGKEWVGKRVRYSLGTVPRDGTVVRMASSRHLAMFVKFDLEDKERVMYASSLVRIGGKNG